MKIQNVTYSLITISIIIGILIFAQSIIIPFVVALLIWFIVKKMRNLLDHSSFIKKNIPHWTKTFLASFFIFGVLFFIFRIMEANIVNLAKSFSQYSKNTGELLNEINQMFHIDIDEQVNQYLSTTNFSSQFKSLANSLSVGLGNFVMIVFYVTFLFFEETFFQNKIRIIFSDEKRYQNVLQTLKKVDKSMANYISLKSLVNLFSASLSFIILYISGIDSPIFWAFLIFIFNFIPAIGPIFGTIIPSIYALMQFGDFGSFLIIFFGVGTTVVTIGSLVEPRVMGNSLNISPLVTIISLAVWGSIWGILGMLLCVPITVAMIIIFAQFDKTKPIAILLSEKGII